jgi:hypothetical protein
MEGPGPSAPPPARSARRTRRGVVPVTEDASAPRAAVIGSQALMHRFPMAFGVIALVGALVAAPVAAAQEPAPTAAEVTLAREQFREGVAAARTGRWWEALEAFTRSYELAPRPATLLNLAGAQVETGHLVEGAESYRRFLREADGRAAQRIPMAEAALAAVEPRIARVRVEIDGLLSRDVVSLDDLPLSEAVLGEELPVNPGAHALRVERDGAEVGRAEFDVLEGERRMTPIALTLPPGEEAPAASAGPSWLRSPWFWAAVGVVVVGAAVGIGVGVATSGDDPYVGNIPPGAWSVR